MNLLPKTQPGRTLVSAGLCALALTTMFSPPARAQDSDPVVATVNGAPIRQSDVTAAEEELGANMPPVMGEQRRDYVLTFLTDTMLVSQAAEKQKLGDTPEFKRKLEMARKKLLTQALLEKESKAGITEQAMRQVYDEATKGMAGEKETRARHILVESEDEAKKIAADLQKGGDFAAIAKEKSKDPGASEGGDLGYFTKDQMVPEFATVAFQLEPGKISEPVKTQFGWHIIKVEDRRDKPVPEFDKVKEQIEQYLTRKHQSELITRLRNDAKIEKVAQATPPSATPAPAAGTTSAPAPAPNASGRGTSVAPPTPAPAGSNAPAPVPTPSAGGAAPPIPQPGTGNAPMPTPTPSTATPPMQQR